MSASPRVGYAVSHSEITAGTVAAAAPLHLPNHDWIGAVSLLFVDSLAPTTAVAGAGAIEAARLIEEAVYS